ncbi:putative coiled coil protein [Salinarchaeum sp. Harcht-Bsk1]|uniref:hypothetical protein n=1 Tax=Salinarchaeum sp. Harcht-Bsk1 TaxID=1333523 RepID=UPI00034243A4|nr:hypothetical protein [Salinarchaeum sp. Harcht-Bsk1]AGN01689.1 putative coiled coil protein [Salinarchaeum sp. Harcht-Bsk1]
MVGDHSRGDPTADAGDESSGGEGEDTSVPFGGEQVAEGEEFEEFRTDVNRAFPEDELSLEELMALPPGEGAAETDDPAPAAPDRTDGAGPDSEPADVDESPPAAAESPPDDVLARFVDAVDSRDLTETERDRLRSALGLETTTSTEVRVRHLQSNLADLEAYVDAMEAFIDERGTARTLLDRHEGRVEDLRSTLDRHDEGLAELRTGFVDHEQRIETTDSRVGAVEERVDELEADRDRLDACVESIELLVQYAEEFGARLDDVEEWQDRVERAFAEVPGPESSS